MEKKMMLLELVKRYLRLAATHGYIFGFVRNKMVYAVKVENAEAIISQLVRLGSASRGKGFSVRFCPNKIQQEIILANASEVKVLCSYEYLENLCAIAFNGKLNDAKNAKFTECGDMNINGKEYQAKFGCSAGAATFTNEETLNNLERERA